MARKEGKWTLTPELDTYAKKHPVDARGYHVLPCVMLTPDNMEPWMKGLMVSTNMVELPSAQGTIEDWDDTHIHIKIGASLKKFKYDPDDIQLCVIQFKQGIVFSNSLQSSTPKEKEPDDVVEQSPAAPPVKKRAAQKKKKTKKKTTTAYKPQCKIEWS